MMARRTSMSFNEDDVIGYGWSGTIVYRGRLNTSSVAVKRILRCSVQISQTDVNYLMEIKHPNIVSLLHLEETKDFWYLVLELCPASLIDYCEGTYTGIMPEETNALKQMVEGVAFIHSNKYIHRNIKPSNIFISVKSEQATIKISDFGVYRSLSEEESFRLSNYKGSMDWAAPEIFHHLSENSHGTRRITSAIDVFALGCVFFYYITKGKHPFGRGLIRINNILYNKFSLSEMDKNHALRNVIKEMIQPNPDKRPKLTDVLNRPVFAQNVFTLPSRVSSSFPSLLGIRQQLKFH